MRAVFVICMLALLAVQCQCKLLSVSGQGVIMTPPPSNVYDHPTYGVDDLSGPLKNGQLAVGGFDEKRVTLTSNFQFTPAILLQAGKTYDSHFLFFHQKYPTTAAQSATATFLLDNKFIGCSSSNNVGNDGAYEVSSTPLFGLDDVLYPNFTSPARGFEGGDFAQGAGTMATIASTIAQPGDFARCLTIACVDSSDAPCECNMLPGGYAPTCASGNAPVCFASPAALLPNASFTSTCPDIQADQSTLLLSIKTCNAADGCTLSGSGGFCLNPLDFSAKITISATAACNCEADFVVELPICGGCNFQTVSTDCHNAAASSAGFSTGLHFDDSVPSNQC